MARSNDFEQNDSHEYRNINGLKNLFKVRNNRVDKRSQTVTIDTGTKIIKKNTETKDTIREGN